MLMKELKEYQSIGRMYRSNRSGKLNVFDMNKLITISDLRKELREEEVKKKKQKFIKACSNV